MMTSDKLDSPLRGVGRRLLSMDSRVTYLAKATVVNGRMGVWALPGRPTHVPAAQKVQMDVEHRLAGRSIGVDHGPVARLGDPFRPGDLGRNERQTADHRRVLRVVERRDMLARHHQHVHRRLRVDVAKRDAVRILPNELRGDLVAYDAAEETVVGHSLVLSNYLVLQTISRG